MRILFCNKYNFGFSGTEAYLFSAMRMMQSRGHETALFSMEDSRGARTRYDQHFVAHRDFKAQHGILGRVRLAAHAVYSLEARRKLRAMIAEFRPDVAHVRNIYHHLSPSILWELKSQDVPVLYHMNDFQLLCPSYNMVSATGEPCERCMRGKFANVFREGCYAGGRAASMVLAAEAYVHHWFKTYEQCVDLILAPSDFVKSKLLENGWDEARVAVLPHFQQIPTTFAEHPGEGGTILYFGRLSREKGVFDLLDAARRLPHLRFVIAGDGPLRGQLDAFTAAFSLANVTFTGHVSGPALDGLIAQSQFTVFPSHAYETFGKSILESYAHGRPVIASDLGSRRELVHPGQTGLLYRAGSKDQLAAAIAFLARQTDLARRMGANARETALKKYSPDQHFQALTSLYGALGSGRQKRRPGPEAMLRPRVAFIGGRGVMGRYSGIESFYEEAGSRLAKLGFTITAYCRSYFTPSGRAEHNGMRIVRLPTIPSKHLDTFVHTLLSTVHACYSDPEVVHFHTLGPALFCWLPRLFGKKTVVTVQGLDWQRKKWAWFARRVLRWGEWASARLPNQTVVVSRILQNYYRSTYSREVTYIANGTELREQQRGDALARFGIQSGSYILFLGRFSPEKNCDMLVEAFEAIDTDMKLVLAGGSSYTDAYAANLRQRASERVLFLDWLSGAALEEVLTNAALFVLPSDMEGLSLALLDAMGAGLCVLASDVPENCEALGDAGFTFRRGDRQNLRQMISLLLSHEDLRREAGRKARERVRQNYLWDDIVQQLAALYAGILTAPASDLPASREMPTNRKAA